MSQEIKKGDMVRILRVEKTLEMDYDVGDICEVHDKSPSIASDYQVWNTDRSEFWFFQEHDLEKVEDEQVN